jgi:hypothetical protein
MANARGGRVVDDCCRFRVPGFRRHYGDQKSCQVLLAVGSVKRDADKNEYDRQHKDANDDIAGRCVIS